MLILEVRERKRGEGEQNDKKKKRDDLERWVQLVMGFIYLGLLCFTVQTVSVKVRLQRDGQRRSSKPNRSVISICFNYLLAETKGRKPKNTACVHLSIRRLSCTLCFLCEVALLMFSLFFFNASFHACFEELCINI